MGRWQRVSSGGSLFREVANGTLHVHPLRDGRFQALALLERFDAERIFAGEGAAKRWADKQSRSSGPRSRR